MPVERVTRRFRITGRVQGVYFRQSTRVEADRLGIRGVARNLPDGAVEVVADGAHEAVETLRLWLHRGPVMARVDAVRELEPQPPDAADRRPPEWQSFSVE